MSYRQPPAPSAPPVAANALEWLVYNYQKTSHEYHSKLATAISATETPAEKAARIADWEKQAKHLERERRRAVTLADLEIKLEKYRKEAWGKTRAQLRQEKHSPTRTLARNLVANQEPKPSTIHEAHHIIPGLGTHPQMIDIRLKLHDCKIGINDAFNGVWLPKLLEDKGHHLTPTYSSHQETLGWNYQQWIAAHLQPASTMAVNPAVHQTDLKNASPFVRTLLGLKQRLKSGRYPPEVGLPKDPNWDGKA